MNRQPLQAGTILRFPDGQEHEILRLLGAGGSALLYETKILGSELYAAVKELYPIRGYTRQAGQILSHQPLREQALTRHKQWLTQRESRLSQLASRKNYQVLPLQPPVWPCADLLLPDGTVLSHVPNTYVRMDSLAQKGIPLARLAEERTHVDAHWAEKALAVMETVLDGYAALHEDGIFHGDCQLSNLFLLKAGQGGESAGTACIIDFGSARELDEDGFTAPISDELFSTDGYCAPELMFPRGDSLRLSAAADVWSLGFLLLNLLTCRNMDGLDGLTEYLMVHPEEKFLSPDEIAALGLSTPQAVLLNSILERAMANEPEERFQTAGDMRAELLRLKHCRRLDPSAGLDRFLLWEAVLRHSRVDPAPFRTHHTPRLTDDLPALHLPLRAGSGQPDGPSRPVKELLQLASQYGENVYLWGPGGGGKSLSAAALASRWLETGERIPLYLNLSACTETSPEHPDKLSPDLIPSLLARRYFGCGDLGPALDELLQRESCFLLLDDLHKVDHKVLPAVIFAINGLEQRYHNLWVLVLGRAEDPGAHAPLSRNSLPSGRPSLRNLLRGEDPFFWEWEEELPDTSAPVLPDLSLRKFSLLPLTTEDILRQVGQLRPLDFEGAHSLLSQSPTLGLPLFLMGYLELLCVHDSPTLPDGAMALMDRFFSHLEHDRETHELLNVQLPWIAYRFHLSGQSAHSADTITGWLREHCGWDMDEETFFRRSADQLAVLEPCPAGYRFTHDCYEEYFAALFAANSVREALSRRSGAPLKSIAHFWSPELTAHCLDLCCLTRREEEPLPTKTRSEMLNCLARLLLELPRRELIAVKEFILNFSPLSLQIARDPDSVLLWRKVYLRCISTGPEILLAPLSILFHLVKPGINGLKSLAFVTEDGEAEYTLACCYRHGIHTRPNSKKAETYLRKSAGKGYPHALNDLGEQEEASGNLPAALPLYQQAARRQHPRAMWHLGTLHLRGTALPQDPSAAFQLFRQGAELGDMLCQYQYGQLLEVGFDGPRAPEEVLHWYQLSADQGFTQAAEAVKRLQSSPKTP